MQLTINEIYCSIQGESTYAGRPCVFVRLTACDLRCSWCDTTYAFTEGGKRPVAEVVDEVLRLDCPLVEITGGEPLLQKNVIPLMEQLLAAGKTVMLETGGHISIEPVPSAVVKIVDVKCPGSGEAAKMHWRNLELLAPHDEVKFVIKHREDYEYARDVVRRYELEKRAAALLFSPVHGVMDPQQLSAWIIEDKLPVRLQLQLHKYIWEPTTRGV
jgi:7-carboxy-7-deazaguanine synthase